MIQTDAICPIVCTLLNIQIINIFANHACPISTHSSIFLKFFLLFIFLLRLSLLNTSPIYALFRLEIVRIIHRSYLFFAELSETYSE